MRGWKDVFLFTYTQNVKGKTYKAALFGIAALIFVIFLAINIIVAAVNDEDSEDEEELIENAVDVIHIVNTSDISKVDFASLTEEDEDFDSISFVEEKADTNPLDRTDALDSDSREIVLQIQKYVYDAETEEYLLCGENNLAEDKQEDDGSNIVYRMTVYIKSGSVLDNDEDRENISEIIDKMAEYFETAKYVFAGINQEGIDMLNSEVRVDSVEVEEAGQSLTEILAKIFIPMIVCLVVYMLVLLHGQSISKVIVVEKSSKLMETLLTSIQPYAIVFGKILAMFTVALIQIAVWITSGFLGYIVGDKIASSLYSGYENPINTIINIFKMDSGSAFSLTAIILGILILVIGFFMYCVMAAFCSSGISKPEDVSNGYALFQMIVVVGFLAAYMIPLMGFSDTLVKVLRFIPITAAFMLPSDVIIGSCSILVSVISLGIILVTTAVMIFFTGKMYKKKVF